MIGENINGMGKYPGLFGLGFLSRLFLSGGLCPGGGGGGELSGCI